MCCAMFVAFCVFFALALKSLLSFFVMCDL